ncbi:16S rRNA-processing protein RimM [Corynebacterium renale]|nr:16S rRNA-processing protein RimM [Corynebacterium renale]
MWDQIPTIPAMRAPYRMWSMSEVHIGRVVKSHGIRGEVAIEPTTDDPASRFAVGQVLTGKQAGKQQNLTIKTARPHQGRLLVSFEEIADRTAADSLRGMRFYAEPVEEGDGYYDYQLEGLAVYLHSDLETKIADVTGVTHMPNRLLLDITLNDGREAMIPFVEDIVPEVDLDEGFIVIDPPEGLLDL